MPTFQDGSIHTAKVHTTNKGSQQVTVGVILYAGYNGGDPYESQGTITQILNPGQTIDVSWADYQFWTIYSPYTYRGEVWTSDWETLITSKRFEDVLVV